MARGRRRRAGRHGCRCRVGWRCRQAGVRWHAQPQPPTPPAHRALGCGVDPHVSGHGPRHRHQVVLRGEGGGAGWVRAGRLGALGGVGGRCRGGACRGVPAPIPPCHPFAAAAAPFLAPLKAGEALKPPPSPFPCPRTPTWRPAHPLPPPTTNTPPPSPPPPTTPWPHLAGVVVKHAVAVGENKVHLKGVVGDGDAGGVVVHAWGQVGRKARQGGRKARGGRCTRGRPAPPADPGLAGGFSARRRCRPPRVPHTQRCPPRPAGTPPCRPRAPSPRLMRPS